MRHFHWLGLLTLVFISASKLFADSNDVRTGHFPFYAEARRNNIWEYIPLDQGGREIQLQLVGSERDEDFIRAVRRPGFFKPWGEPIVWDSLEKTEPEKSVWLNRWYFLPCYARQFYLTGDTNYLREMLAFMRKWRDENPPPADLPAYFKTRRENWRDMQVAWRMQNLAWCYFLGEKGYSPEEKQELYDMVRTHARFLLSYFGNQPLIENNHQSHGAAAMLYAALLFPDIENADALKSRAIEILNHHLDKAFYDDGNSVELAPGYYPFFVSIFRDAYLLCLSNNFPPPPCSEERLKQFYNYIDVVRQPDDTMPPINDSSESSATVPLQVLADLLKLPAPHAPVASHWFNVSHQAVMRDAGSLEPAYVFLDAGPQVYAHWHGGKLGFHLWYWDRALVIDSGICDYDDPLRRSWFWNPESHNTLLVDGKGDYYKALTRITNQPFAGSRIDQWESNSKYDWAVMRHAGFRNRKTPAVSWTRHFILLKGVASLIVDQLESVSEHDYTWLFHLLPCEPKTDAQKKSVFTALPEKNLLLLPSAPEKLIGFNLADGIMNRRGVNLKDPVVHYATHASSCTQTFLFAPVEDANPPDLHVEQSVKGDTVEVRILGKKELAKITLKRDGNADTGKFTLQLEENR